MRNRKIRMGRIKGYEVQANTIYIPSLIMDVKISKVLLESVQLRTIETKTLFVISSLKYRLKDIYHTFFNFIESKPLPLIVFKIPSDKIWIR